MRKTINGFTVVELLIIISIISILVVTGTMSFVSIQAGARNAEKTTKIGVISNYLETYYHKHGEYPLCSGIMDQPVADIASNTLVGIDTSNLAIPGANTGTNSIVCSDTTDDAFVYLSSGRRYTLKYKSEQTGQFISVESQKQPKSVLISIHGGGGGGGGGGGDSATSGGDGGNSTISTNGTTLTAYAGSGGTKANNGVNGSSGGADTPNFTNTASPINGGGASGGGGGDSLYEWCSDDFGGSGGSGGAVSGELDVVVGQVLQITVGAGGAGGSGANPNDCGEGGGPGGADGNGGIVTISFLTNKVHVTVVNGTESTNGSYTVYTFTSDGSLTIN
jgi:type II secretory pathway pseudopilin PulG